MDFRILGPLEVRDRGGSVEVRGQKPRSLLALLVLHAREPVSSDALIDALWGESPPRTARAALQNYVAQLRRALGPGLVESEAGGYVLEAGPEQIDLDRFERALAEARRKDGEERVEQLRAALALWRGPPLADLAYEPFAAREASRLEELHAAALEDLLDARLAVGDAAELVPQLEQAIEEHPFRERLRGQLMLALYRSGRQAEALHAYREARRLLVDELGIEPGSSLKELEQAILRQDSSLGVRERPRRPRPSSPAERRKTLTVLFADLDSPATADPELQHDASLRALARMRTILEEHGATIEQRAGDEVMAVFGMLQSHEDDALRAARAALALEAALARLSDELEREGRGRIELRIALDTGPALVGVDETVHGFAAGPAVTSAKRALQRAGPGEILAGEGTLRLLGETAVVASRDGRNGGRLVGLREEVPVPPRRASAPLVDRESELDALRSAFAEAVERRRCRLALVLGEPGIGKTRLTAELTAELAPVATILLGRCSSYGKGATFLPLAEMLEQVQERYPLRELLAGEPQWELIASRLASLTGEGDAPGSGGETFWAIRRLLEALARERPLVLVLEDLHWGEPTLLDLVEYLAERVSDAPVLLLALARPELLEDRPAWREREPARLAPLSHDDSHRLLDNLGAVPADLGPRIVDTAGGNPLFIEQLWAHAEESPALGSLPPSLDALIASRLDRLEPAELAVLQHASVAGRDFSAEAVAELMDGGDSVGRDALAGAARKGLIHSGATGFRFHHVLIRDSAYATLPLKQRATLHERYARRLERVDARADELIGFHLEQAHESRRALGRDGDLVGLAAEAGSRLGTAGLRAWRRADVTAAVNLLQRAVTLLPAGEPSRPELLCELGLALRTAGALGDAERVLAEAAETAEATGDRRLELRARLELANVGMSADRERTGDELLALALEAIPVFEQHDDQRALGRAWLLSGYVRGGLHCRNAEWQDAAERALEHYRRSRWPTAACFGEIAVALYYGPTPVAEGIERCERLVAEAREQGGRAHVLVWLGGLEAMAGRVDRGRELVAEGRSIYEELGYRVSLANACGAVMGEIELLADRTAAAEEWLQSTCASLADAGMSVHLSSRAAELAEALYRRQRYDEAEHWIGVSADHSSTDDVGAALLRAAVLAKVLARRDDLVEAEAAARHALELAEETDALNSRAKALLDLAEVVALAGRSEEATEARLSAVELFEQKGNMLGAAQARRALATTG